MGLNTGIISNSYAGVGVDVYARTNRTGGLVGEEDGAVDNSYWDIESTTTSIGCGDHGGVNCDTGSLAGATPLTTAQMQAVTGTAGTDYPDLGDDGFQLNAGAYPKLKLCRIDSTTNGCVCEFTIPGDSTSPCIPVSFSTELLPGQ